ncbi:hypothetical protein GGR57DRAFT_383241 [Xylariaceae sp. FL1272]|nr:hypothetical protein GGR57DRAFT_383241 [Xylariaceae sp. FL1272]
MVMQKRRAHKKSRRGCLNCKKWHTKCDESGPPCKNCTLRNAKCEYSSLTVDGGVTLAQSRRSQSFQSSTSNSEGRRLLGDPGGLVLSECRRVLELDLMHCWSTTTYKSLCSVPEDHHYMQLILPQEALRYDFLMNGIFVASALHRATMVPEPEARQYYNTAMELYDRASRSFRTHLGKMSPETHHMLYTFSSLAAFINIAFSQYNFTDGDELNTLSTVAVAFDLLNGSANIAQADFQRLLESPVPVRAYLSYGTARCDTLDLDTQGALARLEILNETYHSYRCKSSTPLSRDDASGANTPRSGSPPIPGTPWSTAAGLLQRCFAEDLRGVFRGFCFVFPGAAGPQFATAVKASDPMALMILMHWTVLLSRVQGEYWWAKNLGPRLAVGIWKALQLVAVSPSASPVMLSPEWAQSIDWVCSKLNLPEFVHVC